MMDVQQTKLGEVPVVQLFGRLDAGAVPQFKKEVAEVLKPEGAKVIFDFQELTFIDSSGLGAMVSLLKQIAPKNGNILLANLRPEVLALFELTRLTKVFDIYSDLDGAVASLQ